MNRKVMALLCTVMAFGAASLALAQVAASIKPEPGAATMPTQRGTASGDEWFLLKADLPDGPQFVAVMPRMPSSDVRARYPVRVTLTVDYEATENGLPMYEDDLEALNALEQDFRSWDPDEAVFRNAIRFTGGGERKWVLYATSAEAFQALVPENDFIVIATVIDPDWSEVAAVLDGVKR